jgi:hypothetical protein
MNRIPILFILICPALFSMGQSSFTLAPSGNKMIIKGTSTLHDWQCKVEQMSGQMSATVTSGVVKEIQNLTFSAAVNSIRSIKENGEYYEKGMDKNVYKALKSDQYAAITFALKKVNSVTAAANNKVTIVAAGTLTISGTPKEVTLTVSGTPSGAGYAFEGTFPMKMTDFKIEPPTALLGTIRTGDAITVEFKTVYNPR